VTDKTSSADPTPRESLTAIRVRAEGLVAGSADPYEAGRDIQFTAMAAASGDSPDGEQCWALWLLWGALTDWSERKPDERPHAEVTMLRAAKEWLEVPDNEPAWRRYFDHWLYSEMGLERPQTPQPVPRHEPAE
jgi:hypothetical protein